MWQLDNRTPFAAERGWVRDLEGAETWLVAVKATFDIAADGALAPSLEQPPVLDAPVHWGEPGKSSLRYDVDLVLAKKTTDVLVLGHACAPAGSTATFIDAGFRVGPIQKVLRVFGDRCWGAFGASDPLPFDRVPLTYERAFGGRDSRSAHADRDWEWRNPVGTGFVTSRANAAGVALPNVEIPGSLIKSWSDRPAPGGFGPVCCHWQPRAALAGTYDDDWRQTRQPLLPRDFDIGFFQCAPLDQQAPRFLRGGEPVLLRNLSPRGDLRFLVPKVYLGFETRFLDGSRQVHQTRHLHTVIIEPDFPRVSVVWHTALQCHFKVHKLEKTIIRMKADVGRPLSQQEELELELESA